MWKETLKSIGAVIGLLAAILAILDRLLSLRERWSRAKKATKDTVRQQHPSSPPRRGVVFPYLVQEVTTIVAAGLLLNYIGLAVVVRLKSVLYLDMAGTALAAFLLGPWWGAVTGLVSNSVINWLLYPEPNAELIVFPWSLVNMTGGIFWGVLARGAAFRNYLADERAPVSKHFRYLLIYGVLAAGVMAVVGTMVQAALPQQTVLALDTRVASAIDQLLTANQGSLGSILAPLFGHSVAGTLAWAIPHFLQNWIRYVPDKTLSAAFALATLRYGFPVFERELILYDDQQGDNDNWLSPLILALFYTPPFIVLLSQNIYRSATYWLVWCAPWLSILFGLGYQVLHGPTVALLAQQRERRLIVYRRFHRALSDTPTYAFFRRLNYATLGASAVFVLCLPLLEVQFYRIAFNFFCVVYGGLLAMHLVRVGVCQNISLTLDSGRVSPRGRTRRRVGKLKIPRRG
jgi:hypothetical protein